MQFSSAATARTYSDRSVDSSWNTWAALHLQPDGKDVIDIGCGGGIYSRGFAAIGARSVIGIDQSPQYVDEATASVDAGGCVAFRVGRADATGLPGGGADIVFERAVIHHLAERDKQLNAIEAHRLLRPGGVFAVQDRTIEDVQSSSPDHWIRSTLFEAFAHLVDFEKARRPSRSAYTGLLRDNGFASVRELPYAEVRKTYATFDDLQADILSRKGKSILFELDHAALRIYCDRLRDKAKMLPLPLVERDLWTVWLATK
jgi:ubiquinone/menaquinone biosynthesis C-methylase UbiE